jgi:hypothetical protein
MNETRGKKSRDFRYELISRFCYENRYEIQKFAQSQFQRNPHNFSTNPAKSGTKDRRGGGTLWTDIYLYGKYKPGTGKASHYLLQKF